MRDAHTTALLTDFALQADAYSYDPYGVAVLTQSSGGNGEVQNPFLFQGGIKDRATGWVHFGARWYNPSTGRWTQQDTLDAPLDPTNANRYAFAGNDPVNNHRPNRSSQHRWRSPSPKLGALAQQRPREAGIAIGTLSATPLGHGHSSGLRGLPPPAPARADSAR